MLVTQAEIDNIRALLIDVAKCGIDVQIREVIETGPGFPVDFQKSHAAIENLLAMGYTWAGDEYDNEGISYTLIHPTHSDFRIRFTEASSGNYDLLYFVRHTNG